MKNSNIFTTKNECSFINFEEEVSIFTTAIGKIGSRTKLWIKLKILESFFSKKLEICFTMLECSQLTNWACVRRRLRIFFSVQAYSK